MLPVLVAVVVIWLTRCLCIRNMAPPVSSRLPTAPANTSRRCVPWPSVRRRVTGLRESIFSLITTMATMRERSFSLMGTIVVQTSELAPPSDLKQIDVQGMNVVPATSAGLTSPVVATGKGMLWFFKRRRMSVSSAV